MKLRFNESRPIETRTNPDGTTVSVIPLSRRFYRIALLFGVAMLPLFVAAPFLAQSFSIVFTCAWSVAMTMFFILWFWGAGTYLFYAERYGLEIDGVGIRERLLTREYSWKWEDVDSIQLRRLDNAEVIVLLLKEKSWKRKMKLASYDGMVYNRYALSTREILEHLHERQEAA